MPTDGLALLRLLDANAARMLLAAAGDVTAPVHFFLANPVDSRPLQVHLH